ncbi:MAG: hypothetical protein ACE5IQ_00400 [Candidatus Methylomirabilales bacterium]
MEWVKLPHERPCETCGAAFQRWVRSMGDGQRAVEVTFCPFCSLEVKRMVETEVLDTSRPALC